MNAIKRYSTKLLGKIKNNIHYKLFFTVFMFMAFLLIFIVSISFYFSTRETYKEIITSNHSSMEMAQAYLQEKIDDYDELLYSILFDERFITSLKPAEDKNGNDLSRYIENRLINLFNSDPKNIFQISTYTVWNDRLVTILKNYQKSISYQNPEWKSLEYEDRYFFEANNEYFTLKRNVNDFYTREPFARVSMSIEWSVMDKVFEMLDDQQESILLIVDSQGQVTHNPFPALAIPSEIREYFKEKNEMPTKQFLELNNYYLFSRQFASDFYITKFISKDTVFIIGHSIIKTGIIIGMLAIIILLGLSIVFYWQVTKPIRDLANEMDKVVIENFQTSIIVPQHRFDEIGVLQKNFVKMVQKIKHLIETEYKHELEKQHAQYQALQNKINPHFIRNSLQLIGQMALSNRGKKVYTLVDTLGKMFQYTLRANKDIATIKEEIRHVKQYLYIQKQRFNDRLVVDLYVDEEVENASIPILTLQPIVENAFIHGFDSDNKQWKIFVSLERVLSEVEIRIKDNGKGINPFICREMNQAFKNGGKDLSYVKKNMGLHNVNNRLILIYGKEYGLKILSEQNKGTEILIRIPLIF